MARTAAEVGSAGYGEAAAPSRAPASSWLARLRIPADDHELIPPAGLLLVATLHAEPVGCGAVTFHGDAPGEIKRMWIAPTVRGLGLGRRLLAELETHAAAHHVRTLRLETNRTLDEAIGLYRAAGYREVTAFNDEMYADHWFEKTLDRSAPPPQTLPYRQR